MPQNAQKVQIFNAIFVRVLLHDFEIMNKSRKSALWELLCPGVYIDGGMIVFDVMEKFSCHASISDNIRDKNG